MSLRRAGGLAALYIAAAYLAAIPYGGVWFVLMSWVALRARVFPRALNWLGLVVGAAALLSAVPPLAFLEAVASLLQIVWFACFGIITVRIGTAHADRVGSP